MTSGIKFRTSRQTCDNDRPTNQPTRKATKDGELLEKQVDAPRSVWPFLRTICFFRLWRKLNTVFRSLLLLYSIRLALPASRDLTSKTSATNGRMIFCGETNCGRMEVCVWTLREAFPCRGKAARTSGEVGLAEGLRGWGIGRPWPILYSCAGVCFTTDESLLNASDRVAERC